MATKKEPKIDNKAFMKSVMTSGANAIKAITDEQEKKVNELLENKTGSQQTVHISKLYDAPEDMNDWPLLRENQPERYMELKVSIYDMGVLQPLIVWEKTPGRYMILAGRNRKTICQEILDENKDNTDFDREKYENIKCVVIGQNEIDQEGAQQIIDDTNTQREFSKLPPKIKINIMKRKIEKYKKNGMSGAQRIESIAKEFGMEKSAVYENIKISSDIIPEICELYYDQRLNRKQTLKFAWYSKSMQEWIYENFHDEITAPRVDKMKKDMSKDDLRKLYEGEVYKTKKMTITVPEEISDEIRQKIKEMIEQYNKEKQRD